MLIRDVQDVLLIAFPAIGALLIGMALSRKLAEMDRDSAEADRRLARLAKLASAPVFLLRRPNYRPRHRFSFRTLRSASLWVILTALASRSHVRCTPDPQPTPAIIDCARDRTIPAQVSCALAEAVMFDMIERLHR